MLSAPPPSPRSPARPGPLWPLWLLTALTALPELVFLGADRGVWGHPIWRPLAYQYGAVWVGLWQGWQPNYAAQPWVMILTYPWLHTGLSHLAGNLMGLWLLSMALRPRWGTGGVLALWAAGVIGGGIGFGLLASGAAPMVGASGAVFGLAGGWWVADLRAGAPGLRRALRAAGLVLAAAIGNVLMDAFTPGGIAWQTHLGGALAGAALALCWRR